MQKKIILLSFLLSGFVLMQAQTIQLYVAPNGNDKNDGSIHQPLATLQKAKELVRQLKKSDANKQGITVFIRGGNYSFTSSLELTKDDSGEEGKPISYESYPNETPHFIGGSLVDINNWKPLDKKAAKRVHPKISADKLVELDVAALGFKNITAFAPKNQFTTEWYIIDLFANDVRQPLSQWPNPTENIRGKNDAGWTTCNGSKDNTTFYFGSNGKPEDKDTTNELDLDGTNRSERWYNILKSGHELWLKGLWRTPWEPRTHKVNSINLKDQSIELTEEPPQGMGSKYTAIANEKPLWRVGSGKEGYYALNLLEEIDMPGEWALDVVDKKLYYYPPAPLNSLKIMISDMKAPIIKVNGASYIAFKNIQVEGGLGNGFDIINSNHHITVAGCNIINVGNTGININGGDNQLIQSNDIAETGGLGIQLANLGNRAALTSSNTIVTNNHIHHVGKLVFREAINVTNSVGITISHNLLHDIPKGSIHTMDMNNCILEYNEMHNIALKEGDNGVFYNYGGWSTYGNIFIYNFAHHINRSNAFYSDDGDSGDWYYKNIVQDCISGVKFGGGHDNLAENNLFIQSKDQTVDDRGKDRNYRLGTKYETNLTQFNIDKGVWKEYAVQLMKDFHLTTNLWSDVLNPEWHAELPNGCRMKDNVAVASGKFQFKTGKVESVNNTAIKTIAEAGFYDYKNMDLRTNNPQILEKFPELNEVFPTIGLQKDTYRKTIPTRKETGGLTNRTNAENIDAEDKMTDKIKANKS